MPNPRIGYSRNRNQQRVNRPPDWLRPFLEPGGLLKKQASVARTYEYRDISPAKLNAMMESASKGGLMSGSLSIAMGVYNELSEWIASYARKGSKGVSDFLWHWKIARNILGLQVRLLVEQIAWDMGPPWNQINTGFKAIGEKPTRSAKSASPQSGQGATSAQAEGSETGTEQASGRPPTGEAKGRLWV